MSSTNAEAQCICCNQLVLSVPSSRFSCGCSWCYSCIEMAFSAAASNESFWPVECCERIELDSIRHHLTPTTLSLLEQKIPMYDTPAHLRVYCHNRHCSAFIWPEYVKDGIAECVECEQWTCMNCKNAAHEAECVLDEATRQIYALAATNYWRQCSQCNQMIERTQGCAMMTCGCGHIFCYRCGVAWHECLGMCAPEQDTVFNDDEQSNSDSDLDMAEDGFYDNEAEPEF